MSKVTRILLLDVLAVEQPPSLTDTLNDTAHNVTIEMTDFQSYVMEMRAFREEIREEIRAHRLEAKRLNDSVVMLANRIDNCENDIELTCIPEQKEESLLHIVSVVATKLGVDLSEQDIVSAARMGRTIDATQSYAIPRPRPIVVRLERRATRDKLHEAAKVRRGATTEDMGFSGKPCRFFINERLTKHNRQLFKKARDMGRSLGWRYIWTKDGRVFARQRPGSDAPRRHLRTEADLDRIFGTATKRIDNT
ncbi:unnamed protein product [Diatraea saccharalis]|uniref:FP protein C-terminal domain-containing protein n=1 Tax=Diatraea saccharalis TaxID=40085 RepID=A0A9N9RE06_9NEOP|nr:unnamed protein product [Diatraea saccharalis]